MQHPHLIYYNANCHYCKSQSKYLRTVLSEKKIINPKYSELLDFLDYGRYVSCPNCGRSGNIEITTVEWENLIFDIREEPLNGIITLHGKKRKGQIEDAATYSDNQNFTFLDLYNALTIFEERAFELNEKNKNKINLASTEILFYETFGHFSFKAKFSNTPPYITLLDSDILGFTYEEIDKIISDLKRKTLNHLKEKKVLI